MDFSKFETKEDVLDKVRKLRDKLDKVDDYTAARIRYKIKILLDFYKHFEEAQMELV